MFEYYLCYVLCIAFALSSSFDVILLTFYAYYDARLYSK